MPDSVPFLDLSMDRAPFYSELLAASAQVLAHGQYIGGPEVARLEAALARYVGVPECLSCSSGTTALLMALIALEVGPGDEVIVPAYTFAAPVEAILLRGATPVLADIDPVTCLVSIESVENLLGPRTRAIIAVSLYGQPADFTRLEPLAARHGVHLIEDAAQSFGGSLDGRRSGGFGDIACTSFYPTKPLGGCGDGGALFTRDPALAAKLRQVRDHGQSSKYHHVRLGLNGRLDTIACANLLIKLAHFPAHLERRQELARRYDSALAKFLPASSLPRVQPAASSSHALYCISLEERDLVRERLTASGIGTAIHYPSPLHQQPAFAKACRWQDLGHSEAAARRGLCLPLFPGLTDAGQDRVVARLEAAVS